jgi:DNA-damage-inducible protein D
MNEGATLSRSEDTSPFERIRSTDVDGAQSWSSRDFALVLSYLGYRNFEQVAKRTKTACFNRSQRIENHFVDITEMIAIGKGGQRPVGTVCMSRCACYLVAKTPTRREKSAPWVRPVLPPKPAGTWMGERPGWCMQRKAVRGLTENQGVQGDKGLDRFGLAPAGRP